MFYALVETNIGDNLNIIRSDKHIGGEAILSFLLGLSGYCSSPNDPGVTWFDALASRSTVGICHLLGPLLNSFYSGDWNYQEDEFEIFQRRQPELALTEEEFIETVHDVQEKWTDLVSVLSAVEALLTLMKNTELTNSSWYNGHYTIEDFEALLQTLQLAHRRKARQVRIRFS